MANNKTQTKGETMATMTYESDGKGFQVILGATYSMLLELDGVRDVLDVFDRPKGFSSENRAIAALKQSIKRDVAGWHDGQRFGVVWCKVRKRWFAYAIRQKTGAN